MAERTTGTVSWAACRLPGVTSMPIPVFSADSAAAAIGDALEEAHKRGGPVVVDVKVDPTASHRDCSDYADLPDGASLK